MLIWRLTLGTLFIAGLTWLCWADYHAAQPGLYLFPLALVLAVLAVGELLAMFPGDAKPVSWSTYAGTLAVVGLAGVPAFWSDYPADCPIGPLGWPLLGLAAGVLLAVVGEMQRYVAPGRTMVPLALSLWAMVYVGVLLAFIVQLRGLGNGPEGLLALVSMVLVVKMSDIGAYTVGRLAGRRKLAPTISPGKTWEGFAGGMLFALVSAYLFFAFVTPGDAAVGNVPQYGWVAYAVALTIAGLLGDLAESLMKRDAGCKDSSRWMPGFGGVLDLLDSPLAAAPVAYLFWAAGWVGW